MCVSRRTKTHAVISFLLFVKPMSAYEEGLEWLVTHLSFLCHFPAWSRGSERAGAQLAQRTGKNISYKAMTTHGGVARRVWAVCLQRTPIRNQCPCHFLTSLSPVRRRLGPICSTINLLSTLRSI